MEITLLLITGLLAFSFLFSELFHRLGSSRVVGQITAGVIIGLPIFSFMLFSGQNYFNALDSGDITAVIIDMLSSLGIILLLLLTGLEIDYEKLKKVSKDATVIAISAALVPFILGFLYTKFFLGYSDLVSMIVGACMSVTAEGTKIMVLMELGKLKTRVGEIMLGAGIIDDLFEILFLALVLMAASQNVASPFISLFEANEICSSSVSCWLITLFLEFVTFIALSYLIFRIFPVVTRYVRKEKSEISEFMVVIIVGLFIAEISGLLGLGTIIGAFIAGVIIQLSIKNRKEEQKMVKDLSIVALGLVVPFFFIAVGLNFNFSSLLDYPLTVLSIIILATLGKILGTLITKPFTGLNARQLYLIGWGMNSRGAVELVIASVAYTSLPAGVFPSELFSSLVVMAVTTTLIFPFILRHEIRKNPEIMD